MKKIINNKIATMTTLYMNIYKNKKRKYFNEPFRIRI